MTTSDSVSMRTDEAVPSETIYVLGRSEAETGRLIEQSRLFNAVTLRLLRAAGVKEGMRVLEIGCGAGDVTMIAAHLVGPTGTVVGVDANESILATARERVAASGQTFVSFVQGTPDTIPHDQQFDVIIGRFVVMYFADPVETIGKVLPLLDPAGPRIVAFQEFDYSAGVEALSMPHSALYTQMGDWWLALAARGGIHTQMGLKLFGVLKELGADDPRVLMETVAGGGEDFVAGYGYLGDCVRSMRPMLAKLGIADVSEEESETFGDRVRQEVVANNGMIVLPPIVGTWAIMPVAKLV